MSKLDSSRTFILAEDSCKNEEHTLSLIHSYHCSGPWESAK